MLLIKIRVINLSARGNFTFARNEIREYDQVPQVYPWLEKKGTRLNSWKLYIADGLYTADDFNITGEGLNRQYELKPGVVSGLSSGVRPGDIKYKDLNGDGKIDSNDQMEDVGNPSVPEIVYGFGVSMGYKNFDISCFFQGAARSSFFINSKATNPFMQMDLGGNNLNGMMQAYADDYWSESNRNIYATFPRLSTTDIANNNRNSTWWLRDGSYLRLKSVEIGYTLPKRLTSHLGMSNLRIYASGLNLFAWNRFKLWDVEQGNDGMQYPIQAVYNFGINLSF